MSSRFKLHLFLTVLLLSIISGASAYIFVWWKTKSEFHFDIQKALQMKDVVPLAIIGSGPASLSAGIYGARSGVKTLVIAGNEPGGALTKTSYIENWPGRTKILGTDLMDEVRQQAQEFGAEIMSEAVVRVDLNTWPFEIYLESGKLIRALTVIIGTGSTPRTLGVTGEKEYWGKGVTTCAICDAPFHKDKEVVVVGGGDSAIEEAIQLAPYAKKITILVRKDSMRAAAAMQARLRDYSSIEVKYNSYIKTIVGDGTQVTSVEVFDTKTNVQTTMHVSGVFLAIGHDPNIELFKKYLTIAPEGTIEMPDRTQRTSLKGIYAAGDVTDHRYRQAGVAAGDGIKAALDAVAFLQEIGLTTQIAEKLNKPTVQVATDKKVEIVQMKNLAELEQILKTAEGLVILDFYTPYCPSCLRMLPALESLAHQFGDQAVFYKIDASVSKDIAQKFHVPAVPALLFIKDGGIVARSNQAMSKAQIEELLAKLVESDQE